MTKLKLKFMLIVLLFIRNWCWVNVDKYKEGIRDTDKDALSLMVEIEDKLEEVKQ